MIHKTRAHVKKKTDKLHDDENYSIAIDGDVEESLNLNQRTVNFRTK